MVDDTRTAGATRTTASMTVGDDTGTVTVRKLVSKGERLEIERGDDSITVDALLLEGLSWQPDRAAIDERIEATTAISEDPIPPNGGHPVEDAPEISISNEYSVATVRKVTTADGDGLEVRTPGRGTALTLGPATLGAIAAIGDTYVFSRWFKTPFGPEDTPLEGPL